MLRRLVYWMVSSNDQQGFCRRSIVRYYQSTPSGVGLQQSQSWWLHIPRQRDKLSTNYSRQFHSEKSDALSPSVATTGNQTFTLAATGKSNHQTQGKVQAQGNLSRGKCQFCGSGFHNRRSCPARNDVCHKCGKSGHWQVVCRSQAAAVYGDEESIVASVLCAMPSKSRASDQISKLW